MQITKHRLREIIKEELTRNEALGAHRGIQEVYESTMESLGQAHKDLQMLYIHLNNAKSTTEEVDQATKQVESLMLGLEDAIAEDVVKIAANDPSPERGYGGAHARDEY